VFIKVTIDEKFSEPLTLIDLFGFRGEKTSSSSTYMGKIFQEKLDSFIILFNVYIEHYEKSLNKIWELFPNKVFRRIVFFSFNNCFYYYLG